MTMVALRETPCGRRKSTRHHEIWAAAAAKRALLRVSHNWLFISRAPPPRTWLQCTGTRPPLHQWALHPSPPPRTWLQCTSTRPPLAMAPSMNSNASYRMHRMSSAGVSAGQGREMGVHQTIGHNIGGGTQAGPYRVHGGSSAGVPAGWGVQGACGRVWSVQSACMRVQGACVRGRMLSRRRALKPRREGVGGAAARQLGAQAAHLRPWGLRRARACAPGPCASVHACMRSLA